MVGKDELANFIFCSTLLEEAVAKAYQKISEKVSDKEIAYLPNYIAKDSFKHASAFKAITTHFTHQTDLKECGRTLGEAWVNIAKDAERYITRESEITRSELRKMMEDLEGFEGYTSEEYISILYSEAIKLLAEEYGIDLQLYKTILEWVIEDEKRHIQILNFIKRRINKQT
mgnify:CR=1 FL=1